jgi:hypothetical protein
MPQLTAKEKESQIAGTQQFLSENNFQQLGSVRVAGQGMIDLYRNSDGDLSAVRQSDGFRFQQQTRIDEYYQRFQEKQQGETPFQAEARRDEEHGAFGAVLDVVAGVARYTVQIAIAGVDAARRAAEQPVAAREGAPAQAGAMEEREQAMSAEQVARLNSMTAMQTYGTTTQYVPADLRAGAPSEPPRVSTADIPSELRGSYESGTVSIDVDIRGAQRVVTVLHEDNHYVAEHTRGGAEVPHLLDEGLTELYAIRQASYLGVGVQPGSISYKSEVSTVLAIEKIAGAEEVRRAYYTGDFSAVERAVDARLGEGTFRDITVNGSAPSVISGDSVLSGGDYAATVIASRAEMAGVSA